MFTGRFVNDLNEISRIQQAITQLERENRQDQLHQPRHSMTEMQRRASQLYSMLTTKREEIVKKLNDGTNFVALLQNQLISDRLFDWKNRQKLAQVGVPFDNRDAMLDEIQMEFEFLAEQNWQLHMFASWTLDLLTRGPQINDNHAHSTAANLTTLADQLTKLLFMLISQSFVVSIQPEPVLKTQHKFLTEVSKEIHL
uniref:STAT_alpha domain-containing protein n=1 Tax=Angiostrongylus cantonensis TaxID=6313 RepID=A0A0K0D254_ANGCA